MWPIFTVLAVGATMVAASDRPNILFIMADDLGWGNVGFHHKPGTAPPEVQTPALDKLAASGLVLDRHYGHYTCTPSRSSFLSGRLPVHVQTLLTNPGSAANGIPANMTTIGRKLSSAGYATHMVGKWDVGMATMAHTPSGRGYDSSLFYFEHKNDYWNETGLQTNCNASLEIKDLWFNDGPATEQAAKEEYEEFLFRDRANKVIQEHDPSEPLFLYYAPHLVHCPLQLPPSQLAAWRELTSGTDESTCQAQTSYIYPGSHEGDYACRAQYNGMVNLLDTVIGNITDTWRSHLDWDNTLVVLVADNGVALLPAESGGTNYPLRGGKYGAFEGGIRTTAFVSGGYLPESVRGGTLQSTVHVADWYATFCSLAGIDHADPQAAAVGLPAVDSLDVWKLLTGENTTSPRVEFPVSTQAIVSGDWKLMLGTNKDGGWTGPMYPNATSGAKGATGEVECGKGCLFNVAADPTEHNDLAAAYPDLVQMLIQRLEEYTHNFYSNNEECVDFPECPHAQGRNATKGFDQCSCWAAEQLHGGFFGPYCQATVLPTM